MAIDGKTVGLALSGGGYRASLFGLGTLWRLNDAGLLSQIDRITSVSGGSILSGVLAHRWKQLQFTQARATNFVQLVAEPVQAFCARSIDVSLGLKGLLTPFKSAGEFLIDRYGKDLFGDTTLKDLPVPGPGVPMFTFYATNLQTGRSFRLRQDKVSDYRLGESRSVVVPLAKAVAASSAFPPVFSPIVLDTDPSAWTSTDLTLPDAERLRLLRQHVMLADGGIYDNMGLEQLVGKGKGCVDVVLVSDAGAPFEMEDEPAEDYVRQLGRVRDILIDQTRALRKRWLVDELVAGRKKGAYWGVATRIGDYKVANPLAGDTDLTAGLDEVPTRLSAFEPELQGQLINWGYALCDAALRAHSGLTVAPATGLPLPNIPLQ
jgi:NTE family protein